MNKHKIKLSDDIAETLLITLYAKAVESRKKKPLIYDKKACELIDDIDYDFSKFKNSKASIAGTAIRSSHFDNITKNFISKKENAIVVSIGCGLDARTYRLDEYVNKAIFYSLDIEEVINIRKRLLPPSKNEHYISASMLSTNWMDELKTKHPCGNFIFIIEGVLMYFDEKDNRSVFKELAERFHDAEIHFDMLNTWMSKKSAIHDSVSKMKASFKYGIDDEKEIEKWHPRLKHLKTYYFNDFNGWRKMGITLSVLMTIFSVFKNSSRMLAYYIS